MKAPVKQTNARQVSTIEDVDVLVDFTTSINSIAADSISKPCPRVAENAAPLGRLNETKTSSNEPRTAPYSIVMATAA